MKMDEKDTIKKSAPQGKGKGKNKKQVLNLDEFVNAGQTAAGFAAVPTGSWAEIMDDEEIESKDYGKHNDVIILPTAPKSIRGPDIDLNQVPTEPPFMCYLSNLPFDVSVNEVRRFFKDTHVKNVELLRDSGNGGRSRGQCICEFFNRENLINAFTINQETIKNRPIKLSLRSFEQERSERYGNDRYGNNNDRYGRNADRSDGGEDRTAGDWRAGKQERPMSNFSSNRPYSDSNNHSFNQNRNRDYNQQRNYGGSDSFGGGSDRPNYGGGYNNNCNYNNRQQRMDRSLNNAFPENSNQNRGDYMSKNPDSFQSRKEDEPIKERPRLMLEKRTVPRPELQPPPTQQQPSVNLDSSSQHSNRSESENEDTLRRSTTQEPEKPVERKKLVLLPPSKKENTEPAEVEVKPASNNIFGEAKPKDTAKRQQEIEKKVQQQAQEIEKELSERLEKQPISDRPINESRERRRDYNNKRLSDSGSSHTGGHDRPHYNRSSRGGGGPRNYEDRPSNRMSGGNYRGNTTRDNNNRSMNNNDYNSSNENHRSYEDRSSNRMSGQQRNNRQNQDNLQTNFNKFDVLGHEMD